MVGPQTRRAFLRQATAAIAAMHAPLLFARRADAAEYDTTVQLKKIRLRANDLDALRAFYDGTMSLPVEMAAPDTLRVTAGTSVLEFVEDSDVESPYYHFAFTIPENQLEAAMAWLEPRCELTPVNPRGDTIMHFQNWNAHSCFFRDPAGNILEFIAHHDLGNGGDGEFSAQRIERVSEIGIVVPDVPAFESEMLDAYGLTPYRGSSPVFSPLGGIGGLLITVRENRIWLGSKGLNAAVFPTEVELTAPRGDADVSVEGMPYQFRRVEG